MAYVLIVLTVAGSLAFEFGSKEACAEAASRVKHESKVAGTTAICVAKK